jgi:uncharacterized alpha-E superfamily protein
MISRVAEHCFWMSRYLERSENTARILEVNQTLLLDYEVPVEQQWKPLLIISGIHDMAGPFDAETVQTYLTWEADNHCSIFSSLYAARENGRIIREVISAEMWERLNYYYLWVQGDTAKSLYSMNRSEFYNQVKRINPLINGIGEGTMLHGEAWEFYQLGKYLERACQTARILDVKYHFLLNRVDQVGTPIDNAHWVAILMSTSGYEPYHKSRVAAEAGVSVADFLIYDPLFPRSVLRCLRECQQAAHAISRRPIGDCGNEVEYALRDLIVWLERRTIEDLVRSGLHEALTRVVNEIQRSGETIHQVYFDVAAQVPDASPVPVAQAQSAQNEAAAMAQG